jgi:hypothetical protein
MLITFFYFFLKNVWWLNINVLTLYKQVKRGTAVLNTNGMKVLSHTKSRDQLGKPITVAIVISELGTLELRRLVETKLPSNQDFYVDLINDYKSGEKMYHVISLKDFHLK